MRIENIGRICWVCNSIHCKEYDDMRLNGKPISIIYAYSHNQYHENNLRYFHFQKHFQNHLTKSDKSILENLGKRFLKLVKDANNISDYVLKES
jgi:hypothetical protein